MNYYKQTFYRTYIKAILQPTTILNKYDKYDTEPNRITLYKLFKKRPLSGPNNFKTTYRHF